MNDSIQYIFAEETDSTQNLASSFMNESAHPLFTVIHTDFQTSGRGQKGNSWESEKGKNLLFSIVCFPTFLLPRHQFLLSEAVALGIVDALSPYTEAQIKWPNDIYIQQHKIAGILIECQLTSQHISACKIGIGLNVNQEVFYSSAPNPISLYQITGQYENRTKLLQQIVKHILRRYQQLAAGEYTALSTDYHQRLYRAQGFHPYQLPDGKTFYATIDRVDSDGRIHLYDTTCQHLSFMFKEIIFL